MIIDERAIYESRLYFLYLCISSLSTCVVIIEMCPFLFMSDGSPYLNNIKTPIMSNVNPITLIICCVFIMSNCVDFAVSLNLLLTVAVWWRVGLESTHYRATIALIESRNFE